MNSIHAEKLAEINRRLTASLRTPPGVKAVQRAAHRAATTAQLVLAQSPNVRGVVTVQNTTKGAQLSVKTYSTQGVAGSAGIRQLATRQMRRIRRDQVVSEFLDVMNR